MLCHDFEDTVWPQGKFEILRVKIDDQERADIFKFISKCVRFILKHNQHVLVHCHSGRSRSATIVIALLMRYMNMSMSCAYLHVMLRRPIVSPNNGFLAQLYKYESTLGTTDSYSVIPPNSPLYFYLSFQATMKRKRRQRRLEKYENNNTLTVYHV